MKVGTPRSMRNNVKKIKPAPRGFEDINPVDNDLAHEITKNATFDPEKLRAHRDSIFSESMKQLCKQVKELLDAKAKEFPPEALVEIRYEVGGNIQLVLYEKGKTSIAQSSLPTV